MIINWVTNKAQQFLPVQDTGLDELSVSFDFALSPEIMGLLYAQNDDSLNEEGEATQGEGAAINATFIPQFLLDEHELALT